MERELTKRFLEFLDNSPSCYHVVDNLKKELLESAAGGQVFSDSGRVFADCVPHSPKGHGRLHAGGGSY